MALENLRKRKNHFHFNWLAAGFSTVGSLFSKPTPPKYEKNPDPSEEKAYLITDSNAVARIEKMISLRNLHPNMRSFHQYNAERKEIAIVFYSSNHPSISTFEEIKQMAERQEHRAKQQPRT